ncbi:hypothetical protein GTZ97_02500 [Aquabacterium fontiphilum]|jgi:hypothetical protein|uniref:hypothetical protein n=1 Tax=Aquabacterium fontiphilum TaxID=450365 RepID=UPI0013782A0F|nr:hypothetical protein [Aquabacterium fontiphilum]NBD19544.1 hypothetical protein [Aquabacterium fontiphilum]
MVTGLSDTARRARYRQAALRLHAFLDAQLDPVGGYPDKVTWGYAMTALFAVRMSPDSPGSLADKACDHLARQDVGSAEYSWEFVVHAMQNARNTASSAMPLPLLAHRAKGTRMFNWFLLRQANRGWFPTARWWTLFKLRLARAIYTTPDGFIQDELLTRSLQYHAFCLYVLCELVQQYPKAGFLKAWLVDGVRFSVKHLLPDGSALWLGRGQEQIFGYAALIRAMEFVHARLEPVPSPALLQVQERLLSFQRADGSFPLVLRRRQPEPETARSADAPPGWYGYNTLYDYLPFLGQALVLASGDEGSV